MDVEFKLFGSLTIRQFMSLVGAVIIAGLIYIIATPLGVPGIVFWPIVGFILAIGFAMAFMTINGQPFARWFRNFVFAIFSSQKYVWQKSPQPPQALTQNVPKMSPKSDKQISKELGIMPLVEVMSEKNVELDEDEKKDLSRIDRYFQAEFDKYVPSKQTVESKRQGIAQVDIENANIAGNQNRMYYGDNVVDIGKGKRAVYSNMQNRASRPVMKDDSEVMMEKKIKEILQRQRELDPYIKTMEIEEREKELKQEMRRLYQEIQELNSKK